jgi:hypothetical protein
MTVTNFNPNAQPTKLANATKAFCCILSTAYIDYQVTGDLFQEITRYLNTPELTCEEMAARINAANNYAFDAATLRRIAEALVSAVERIPQK